MSKKDITTIEYFKNPDRFADFFNLVLYHGEEVLHGSQLTAIDSQYNKTTKSKRRYSKKYRDLINSVCAMESSDSTLAILALEPYDYVDYTFPAKVMFYDILEYDRQIRELALRNRRDPDIQLEAGGEYLTGLKKGDTIKPIATVALFLSPYSWDGPKTLHDILDFPDDSYRAVIPDYKPLIVTCEGLPDIDINKLRTGVRQLLKVIKHDSSKQTLFELFSTDLDFQSIDIETAETINTIAHHRINFQTPLSKEVDMKTGFDEIFDELEEQRATIAIQGEALAQNKASLAQMDAFLAQKDASIAQMDASIAQKDASLAQKDEIIAKLISQISDAGMTPVVKP